MQMEAEPTAKDLENAVEDIDMEHVQEAKSLSNPVQEVWTQEHFNVEETVETQEPPVEVKPDSKKKMKVPASS